ncbi:MAG: hypothetical protein HQK78_14010 [Desulfobacterales bacterium]|nr:hypothetical protein [Desulfobacterales bacterium]
MKIYNINPELQKNIWMEMSLHRLIIMPAIIGSIFFLSYLINDNFKAFIKNIGDLSIVIFIILVLFWGTKLASEAIISEVNDRTWDSQRMTTIGPFAMSMGKLLGSTILSWYGGLFCLIAYFISCFFKPSTINYLKLMVIMILMALFCHAMTISFSLVGIRKTKGDKKLNSGIYFLLGFIIAIGFITPWSKELLDSPLSIQWYYLKISLIDLAVFTSIIFSFWALFGLYRNMRAELQIENGPITWLLFLLTLIFYFSGYIANINKNISYMDRFLYGFYISFSITWISTYVMAFGESKNSVIIRFLIDKIKKREWKPFFYYIPLWAVSLFLSIFIYFLIFTFSFRINSEDISVINKTFSNSSLYLFNLLCFQLRDIGIIIFLNLKSGKEEKGDIAAFIYLLILYALIPSLISGADFKKILPVFLPLFEKNIFYGTLPILLQVFIIFLMCYIRWINLSKIPNNKN